MKDKRKFLIVLLLLCVFVSVGGAFAVGGSETSADGWSSIEIEENYFLGTELTLPAVTYSEGDKSVVAEPLCNYPDGRKYASDKLILDAEGVYTLQYSAEIDGRTLTEQRAFSVYNELYTLTGSKTGVSASSAVYETRTLNESENNPVEETGVVFDLQSGVSVRFNRIFDLSETTLEDELMRLLIVPSTVGDADFTTLKLVYTDIYDENNALTILLRCSPDAPPGGGVYSMSYIMAAGTGQLLSGEERKDLVWVYPAYYGTMSYIDFGNKISSAFLPYYDSQSQQVYVNGSFVIDMDDPQYFSTLWRGFTTGEAKLEISVDNIKKDSACFMITEMRGVSSDELETGRVIIGSNPEIFVDTASYAVDKLPYALKGKPYRLFPSSAKDENGGAVNVQAKVFKDYHSASSKAEVPVVGGTFTPFTEGRYTIEYRAIDNWGNESVLLFEIQAYDTLPRVFLSLNSKNIVLSGNVGEKIKITSVAASGGSGKIEIETKIYGPDGEVAFENGVFRPLIAGSYRVVYLGRDYVGQTGVAEYTVTVGESNGVIFENEPVFEHYYMTKKSYLIPAHEAYDYASGQPVPTDYDVFVQEGDTETRLGTDAKYMFKTAGQAFVIYRNDESEVRYPVTVLDVYDDELWIKNIEDYFVNDNAISLSAEKEYVSLKAEKDGGTEFIRKLLANGVSFRFDSVPGFSDFDCVSVFLTDSVDSSIQLKLSYRALGNKSVVSLNNGLGIELSSGFTSQSIYKDFYFEFLNGVFTVSSNGKFDVVSDLSGKPFSGFPSGYVYLSTKFEGVRKNAEIRITNLGGVSMSENTNIGSSKPRIVLLDSIGGEKSLGERVWTSAALAADVLDLCVVFKMTVTDGNSNVITDTEGIRLENIDPSVRYEIELSAYGVYRVNYTAYNENNGREETVSYVIRVVDRVPPLLEIDGEREIGVSLGDTVKIPAYRVSDNETAAEKLHVSRKLVAPDGKIYTLSEEVGSFTANKTGEFCVVYTVSDEEENVSTVQFFVKVG